MLQVQVPAAVAHARVTSAGSDLHAFVRELYPICRSLTGAGLRQTLRLIARELPALHIHEVPTGTRIFDWEVPKEWNIRDAYIKNASGERVVDFRRSNLHVVGYSTPVSARMPVADLRPHLHTLPDHPEWIPFHTPYFRETWGFCLSHLQYQSLNDDEYEVCIDATLEPGHLSYGELYLPGSSEQEILVSCHCCHPSLCNDNLSGVVVSVALARELARTQNQYSYRFLFIPALFGSLTWLARNEARLDRIAAGLVLSCVGDAGGFTYKRSRRGDAWIDRAAAHVLRHCGRPYAIEDFVPFGYDERQYCSPAFDLPVGSLMRTPNGRFAEYHTSADDLGFVTPDALEASLRCCRDIVDILEGDGTYLNLSPKGEPQLGRRGLYRSTGGPAGPDQTSLALLWVLNFSDGRHSLLQIADRADLRFSLVLAAARSLVAAGLLRATAGAAYAGQRDQ